MSTFVENMMRDHLPEHWTPMLPGVEFQLVDVDEGTEEYENVCGKLRDQNVPIVRKLQRIQNPYLWHCYLLKKWEYMHLNKNEDEVILYHETSKKNLKSIIADNFDWRHCEKGMFGEGVSFSLSAEYARDKGNYKGIMFVTRMLRGQCTREKNCVLPPEGFDTTTSGHPNYKVVVGYNDNDFYPEYVVHWDDDDAESSAFPA